MENNIQAQSEQEQIHALPWFLTHNVLTTLFVVWTFGGSVFLLFLNELGLPKRQIGAVLALFPFSQVLALGFAPVAARWGRKRVYVWGFGCRSVVMALLLLLPWALATAGHTAGLIFLCLIIGIFALLRALAETAIYPWSQEFTPNRVRGKFGGLCLVLSSLAAGMALWIAGWIIGHGAGLTRFQVLIAAGCVLGVLGAIAMNKVPGGAPRQETASTNVHHANMLQALRDRNFIAYLGAGGCITLGSLLFGCFLPLYLKDGMGIVPGTVVKLDIVVTVSGVLAGLLLGWAADRVGSRPVLMPAAGLAMLIPLGWLLLPRQISHPVAWCAALYFLNGVAVNGVGIAAGRLLFNGVIPPEQNTAYTAIYYAWFGVVGGIGPLLAGNLLTACGDWQTRLGPVTLDGQGLLFLGSTLLLATGWWLYCRVRPDDRYTTRGLLRGFPWLNSSRRMALSQEPGNLEPENRQPMP